MKQKKEAFNKCERIKKKKDFEALKHYGEAFHTRHFILVLLPKESGNSRVGLTVSKKVGNAVVRNTVKRYLREFYRKHKSLFQEKTDFLIIAKQKACELSYFDIGRELSFVLAKTTKHSSSTVCKVVD